MEKHKKKLFKEIVVKSSSCAEGTLFSVFLVDSGEDRQRVISCLGYVL